MKNPVLTLIIAAVIWFILASLYASIFSNIGIISAIVIGAIAFFASSKIVERLPFGNEKSLAVTPTPDKTTLADIPELDTVDPVNGIWQSISYDWSKYANVFYSSSDELNSVSVFITPEAVYEFFSPAEDWETAIAGYVRSGTELSSKTPIEEIQSVEMSSAAKFHGEKERNDYVQPKMGKKAYIKSRHPILNWDKHGFWANNEKLTVIYLFTKEGDRIRLFQTWDRDLAIKWRTQVSNRIEAVRESSPDAVEVKNRRSDYL